MTKAEDFVRNRLHLSGKFAYSIFAGVFGTILITLFLTTFLYHDEIVRIIPWLIGLNTAITGYSLLDKTRNLLKHKQAFCISAGVVNVIITYGILTLLFFYSEGEYPFNSLDFMLYLIIGIVCSELGAILAIKYFKLTK